MTDDLNMPPLPPVSAYEGENVVRLDRGPGGITGRSDTLARRLTPLGHLTAKLTGRYLVKGWFDREKFSVAYGESNVGKSFFVVDLGLHVAAREEWHGHRISKDAGPVIYVAGEGSGNFGNRIAAARQNNPDLVERAEEVGRFHFLPVAVDLHGPEDGSALAETINRATGCGASLIIVDTLARAMGDGDENATRDMGTFVQNLDRLREKTGAHILVVHHTGKDTTKGARGSVALRAAVDTEIELTRDGAVITAEAKKQRDMPAGKIFTYALRSVEIGTDEDGDTVTSAVVEPVAVKTDPFDGLTVSDLLAVQRAVQARCEAGDPPRFSDQTGEAWVGVLIAQILDLDRQEERRRIKAILETWIKNGALRKARLRDRNRELRPCVEVGEWVSE